MKILIGYIASLIIVHFSDFFFVGPENGYSILFPKATQLVQVDTLERAILNHIFVSKDQEQNF